MRAYELPKFLAWICKKPFLLFVVFFILSSYGITKLLEIGYDKAVKIDKVKSRDSISDKGSSGQSSYFGIMEGTSKCPVVKVEAFEKDKMKHITQNEMLKCRTTNDLQVNLEDGNLVVKGKNINYVRYCEIIAGKDNEDKYSFREYKWILSPKLIQMELKKGETGFIQHALSKRCIRVGIHDNSQVKDPPGDATLMYAADCSGQDAEFRFEQDGLIRHIASGKCVEPMGNVNDPPNDTPLVLGKACGSHFQTALEGLLQHVESKKCVHPLGGGNMPSPGQKLCLYDGCVQEPRLVYRWFVVPSEVKEEVKVNVPTTEELIEIEVQFSDEKKNSDFNLNVIEQDVARQKIKHLKAPDHMIILALDEASSAHIERKLPKSLAYLKERMTALIFEKHSIVSRGDVGENFLTLLKGKSVGHENHKDLFQVFSDRGYVTLLNVDSPALLGLEFPQLKADHNSEPLWAYANKKYDIGVNPYCIGTRPIHSLCIQYVQKFLASYQGKAKFVVSLLSEVTHSNLNGLGYLDGNLLQLLQTIHRLSNTVMVLTSMRGSSAGGLSRDAQGQEEAKRPFFALYTSDDVRHHHSMKYIETNLDKLTTPADIYATFMSLGAPDEHFKIGSNLFHILHDRNCDDVGLEKINCPCVTS